MAIAVGLGLLAFPLSGAGLFWRWVDLFVREYGGIGCPQSIMADDISA